MWPVILAIIAINSAYEVAMISLCLILFLNLFLLCRAIIKSGENVVKYILEAHFLAYFIILCWSLSFYNSSLVYEMTKDLAHWINPAQRIESSYHIEIVMLAVVLPFILLLSYYGTFLKFKIANDPVSKGNLPLVTFSLFFTAFYFLGYVPSLKNETTYLKTALQTHQEIRKILIKYNKAIDSLKFSDADKEPLIKQIREIRYELIDYSNSLDNYYQVPFRRPLQDNLLEIEDLIEENISLNREIERLKQEQEIVFRNYERVRLEESSF